MKIYRNGIASSELLQLERELKQAETELRSGEEQMKRERDKDGWKSGPEKMPSYQKVKSLAQRVDQIYEKVKSARTKAATRDRVKRPTQEKFYSFFNDLAPHDKVGAKTNAVMLFRK